MITRITKLMALMLMLGLILTMSVSAQDALQKVERQDNGSDEQEYEGDYGDRTRIDRYLNVEIWTDHDDDEYYEGDRVKFYFRVSRDAFVAIYSVDSRGRVNLLFPGRSGQDNFIAGGVTHSLPGRNEDYDLVVNGPNGVENVQIIASREPFPIPDWYDNSGLFCDWDDRHDYMDWVNGQYFVKYDGQRFAYDRTSLYVYEWEPEYFQPVYRPYYPNWTVCGNAYVDYWPGSSIYIDGIFWGITPCYIPRIYVGWHTFTVYDHYNYCWEYDVHVTRYNTVVLDQNIIITQPSVRSKFKTVRFAGYQEPAKVGYTDYDKKLKVINSSGAWKTEAGGKVVVGSKEVEKTKVVYTGERKFVQGSAKVVKTERGIESAGAPVEKSFDNSKTRRYGSGDSYNKKSSDGSRDATGGSGSVIKRNGGESQYKGESTSGNSSGRKESSKKKSSPAGAKQSGNDDSGSKKKGQQESP
ncbi:MAG TPA: DUF4384 domain-containing protein, partial [candidate division Zixibacteria bacterium]|nr:DUF4384 domain-containing protein [candidate division Zixibacteria bacterium]